MELVFENGQILAKSQRSNGLSLQNQRTKSIVDLYEAEYNEDFKKSVHIHDVDTSNKNLVDTQVFPEPLVVAPDEQSAVAERSVELGYESTDFTEDSEESTYQSSVRGLIDPQSLLNLGFIC